MEETEWEKFAHANYWGKSAYAFYRGSVKTTWGEKPLPRWEDLGDMQQNGWIACYIGLKNKLDEFNLDKMEEIEGGKLVYAFYRGSVETTWGEKPLPPWENLSNMQENGWIACYIGLKNKIITKK